MNKKLTFGISAILALAATMANAMPGVPQATRSGNTQRMQHYHAPTLLHRTPLMSATPANAPMAEETSEIVYTLHPTKEEFDACTIVNANNDNYSIEYYYVVGGTGQVFDWPIYYNNNLKATQNADDWLITPAVEFKDNENLYTVTIDCRAGSAFNQPEAFEIWLGTTPDPKDMTIKIVDEPGVQFDDFVTLSHTFGIPSTGKYYIGIHITSPKDAWRIMLRDLTISYSGASAAAPLGVENLTATPDPKGASKGTVEFDMPTGTVNGKQIPKSTEITATITTGAGTFTATGHAGDHISKEVDMASGVNVVKVSVSTPDGVSPEVRTLCRCSIDIPVDPVVTSSVSADNMTLTLTWPQVTQGQNNGIVIPDDITYNVYTYVEEEDENGGYSGWVPVAQNLTECKFSYTSKAEIQELTEFIVTAQNQSGESEGSLQSLGSGRLGRLIELPMSEDFSNFNIVYGGYVVEYPDFNTYNVQWGWTTTSNMNEATGNYGAMAAISHQVGENYGQMAFPKFNAKGSKNLIATFTVWVDGVTAPTTVYLEPYNGEKIKIGEFAPANGGEWKTFNFPLPENCNNIEWASIVLNTYIPDPVYLLMIRSFDIHERVDNDMALHKLSVVGKVRLGKTGEVSLTVMNRGSYTAKPEGLRVWADYEGKKIAEVTFDEELPTLQSYEQATITGKFTINHADYVGRPLSIRAELDKKDDDMTNNKLMTSLNLIKSTDPMVNDLNGEANTAGNGIVLSWSNPQEELFVESFENYDHGDFSNNIGGWQNIDFDRKNVWTIEEVVLPDAVTPKAFQVIDGTALNNSSFPAHEGNQYLLVLSAQEAQSDDWFISPELIGADGFSFWTNIVSSGFEETLEVLVSTTDNEFDSFEVLQTIVQTQWGWTFHRIELSPDVKYVALHYCSFDQFGMLLDDFTYSPVENDINVLGFNVYRNGDKIASSIKANTYEDIHSDFRKNIYHVSIMASRNGGEPTELPISKEFSLTSTGIELPADGTEAEVIGTNGAIIFRGFEAGSDAHVFATDGSAVALEAVGTNEYRITVPAGIYIINVGTRTFKVAVR